MVFILFNRLIKKIILDEIESNLKRDMGNNFKAIAYFKNRCF